MERRLLAATRWRRRSRAGVLAGLVASALGAPAQVTGAVLEYRDVVGAAHVAGKYNFSRKDFLNEGADQLLLLGTRVIKVWLTLDPEEAYPFNSKWGAPAKTLVQVVRKPYYRKLFAKPFTTFILVVIPGSGQFLQGMTAQTIAAERFRMYALARYLLSTYRGTGKTFVLQNWEGDHLLHSGLVGDVSPDDPRIRGMIDWLNARQDGVERARRETFAPGVTVAHAVEVNALASALEGKVTVTNDVVPHTHADLYSYSSWDIDFDPERLVGALDYLALRAPPSDLYGSDNIYLGEYGAAQDQLPAGASQDKVVRRLTETALDWGVRYAIYWQLYSNVYARVYEGRPHNADLRSFWLLPPDGGRTPVWKYFASHMSTIVGRASAASGMR